MAERPVTPLEYQTALELSRDATTPPQDSVDFWQLCRRYRGQIFDALAAARALNLLRKDQR